MNPIPGEDQPKPRIAIVLSAGYFGFFAHAGFMLAVEELGIDYAAIAGSSAGAIVAALHAAGLSAKEIASLLTGIRRKDFWDTTGITGIIGALVRKGRGWTGLLRGDRFEELIERTLPVKRFEDCARSLYITAFNLTLGADETFHSGTIADKVRASCSYPFLLRPKAIDGCQYWDGGFLAKVPAETIIEIERPDSLIVHYLPSGEPSDFTARNWTAAAMMETALTAARLEIEHHRARALGLTGRELYRRARDSGRLDIGGLDSRAVDSSGLGNRGLSLGTHWVVPDVPRVSPKDLSGGPRAIEAAYRGAMQYFASLENGAPSLPAQPPKSPIS
ncbi:MAG TPA: patatin-like phospholipase family protein [Blastocatellia bacterium]|nr:patatin-like phospholipase family protein [Blastocatellia bacterium]